MTQLWTIVAIGTGEVLCGCYPTASAGQHPKDAGWAWDAATQRAVRIAAAPDPVAQRFDGTGWGEDAAKVQAMLIAGVKVEAESRRMAVLTRGAGKAAEYRLKKPEADASCGLLATVLNALLPAARAKQYPAAALEMQLTGEKLSVVLARYRKRVDETDAEILRVSAIEQAACLAITAATTATAARTAFAAISWAWKPA